MRVEVVMPKVRDDQIAKFGVWAQGEGFLGGGTCRQLTAR
jgi:hypothetical protein